MVNLQALKVHAGGQSPHVRDMLHAAITELEASAQKETAHKAELAGLFTQLEDAKKKITELEGGPK